MKFLLCLCLTAAAVTGVNASDYSYLKDEQLRKATELRAQETPHRLPVYTVDLDLPAEQRWTEIASNFKDQASSVMSYLNAFVPAWTLPIIEAIAGDIEGYFGDYGEEMVGLADALDLKVGDVVIINLLYQLENIGLNCTNWNTTGPTVADDPGCMDVDPTQAWCYCKDSDQEVVWGGWGSASGPEVSGPGLCTSVVAEDSSGRIVLGRNLDWNVPAVLRQLMVDVDYQRGNNTVFRGTSIVGFVGVINGQVNGQWSASLNERNKGGNVMANILEMLLLHGMTPAQHLRKALEAGGDYQSAVTALSTGVLINDVYFIVGGVNSGEGSVISRDRTDTKDTWTLEGKDWYRLQTNYDHWNPAPVADDRRTPGYTNMDALGQSGLGMDAMFKILTTWPTYNHHTDYTSVMAAFNNTYTSYAWW